MCDYSLHAYPNRLAREGEPLILTSFPGGSRGFAAQADYEAWQMRPRANIRWTWDGIISYLRRWAEEETRKPLPVVCIPPGARLQLQNIPLPIQEELKVGETEEVTFTEIGWDAYRYRDAVRFGNGKEVLLQRLSEKLCARVLSLGGQAEPEEISVRRYSAF